ncbi:hypothetical protein B0H14DRAFT_2620641 [Mycena olivaceomarginata]|nr:hypothetical protein B0H14DRAFT_2620641 [Mycena olivaceomarginata]
MKYAWNLSKRNPDIVNGCFVALNLTGKSTNYAVAPWRELISIVDALPSAQWGRSNLWLPQVKMSHETRWMKEWWMIWTSVQQCRWRPRSPNINSNMQAQDMKAFITDPVPAAEYEEPINELKYAGPIYEPDSFGVPMEYPPNLDAGPVDFPRDILVNPIESAAGLSATVTCTPSILPSRTSGHGRRKGCNQPGSAKQGSRRLMYEKSF